VRTFFDASALTKHYVRESGSATVHARIAETTELLVSVLVVPEIISAFNRLRREGKIDADRYARLKQTMMADVEDATVISLTPSVLSHAVECLERAPLRASDAIHVASAREALVDLFVSGDERQCEAARGMGLLVQALRHRGCARQPPHLHGDDGRRGPTHAAANLRRRLRRRPRHHRCVCPRRPLRPQARLPDRGARVPDRRRPPSRRDRHPRYGRRARARHAEGSSRARDRRPHRLPAPRRVWLDEPMRRLLGSFGLLILSRIMRIFIIAIGVHFVLTGTKSVFKL
jgi:hypothetical protein